VVLPTTKTACKTEHITTTTNALRSIQGSKLIPLNNYRGFNFAAMISLAGSLNSSRQCGHASRCLRDAAEERSARQPRAPFYEPAEEARCCLSALALRPFQFHIHSCAVRQRARCLWACITAPVSAVEPTALAGTRQVPSEISGWVDGAGSAFFPSPFATFSLPFPSHFAILSLPFRSPFPLLFRSPFALLSLSFRVASGGHHVRSHCPRATHPST
jgi:hypothetical protein